ncbi:MAG: NUDIX domain-containing protein [Candidatus Diapherotrites archaeon]
MKTSRLPPKKTYSSLKKYSKKETKKKKNPSNEILNQPLEYVEWLSQKGKTLGKIPKLFAHEHGLLHSVGHVFVIDVKKNIILQYRSHRKKLHPRKWDTSIGGHVHSNETILHGTKREMKEELGITTPLHYLGWVDVRDVQKVGKTIYHHAERVHFHYTFLPKGKRIYPGSEFEKLGRIPIEEMSTFIRKKPCAPTLVRGWGKFGRRIQLHVKRRRIY